jgi:D-hexose-6-phosphate mutarotase
MKQATLIDHDHMVHNIMACYRAADSVQVNEGLLWYSDAKQAAHDIAVKHGVPVYLVVAVSPRFHLTTNGHAMLSTLTL